MYFSSRRLRFFPGAVAFERGRGEWKRLKATLATVKFETAESRSMVPALGFSISGKMALMAKRRLCSATSSCGVTISMSRRSSRLALYCASTMPRSRYSKGMVWVGRARSGRRTTRPPDRASKIVISQSRKRLSARDQRARAFSCMRSAIDNRDFLRRASGRPRW